MIKEALNEYAASLQREWSHDRSQTVGASEIGQCERKTYFVKMEGDPKYGYERDKDYVDGWGAKMRGSLMENHFWAPAMKAKYGDRLLFAGEQQKSFVSGFLSATPDGMLVDLPHDALKHLGVPELMSWNADWGATIMAECKTADPRTNLDEAKPANIFQTHVQMGIVRESTVWRPTHSLLSYMDASFWDEIKEFVIEFDPAIYQAAKDRAARIMTSKSADDLEPEGYFSGGNECKYCPFTKACGVIRMSPPVEEEPVDPAFVEEVRGQSAIIAILEDDVSRKTESLKRMKQDLKDRMRAAKVRKIPGVISWSSVKGRKGYNNKAIQAAAVAAGIDIEKFIEVGEPTDRFTVA